MDGRLFDGQVVRPPPSFREAAEAYVCVRIVNINDYNLNLYRFDYDLTMAIVLAHPDGTVYHRYGGRDHISPMNMATLVALMKEGLATHRRYLAQGTPPPEPEPPLRLRDLIENRLQGRIQATFGCYHCHYAREAKQYLAMESGQWTPDQFWIWPSPERLGLVLDQRKQNQVNGVVPGSPAHAVGFEPGDRLVSLAGHRTLTRYDVQWVLDESPGEATRIAYVGERGTDVLEGSFRLGEAWKVGDPNDELWRVRNVFTEHMIKFMPAPGFIGRPLAEAERQELGLSATRFALRILHLNQGSYLAGMRMGDIVLGAGDRTDFDSTRDFYRWCELLRRAGRDIRVEIMRQGSPMHVMVPLDYLNDSRIAAAPRVKLGFILQELPGNAGLRVGHVTDDSSAEKTGLQIGDRILSADGRPVVARADLEALLNDKSPGDLITLTVRRGGELLHFGYVLPGEEVRRSDLAHLSGTVTHPGQRLTCIVTLKLPPGDHVYSVHREGFGLPTDLEFRGRGYRLVGKVREPPPRKVAEPGLEAMWVLEGDVELRQEIEVLDPDRFQLLLRVYAQVCDETSCHELRAVIVNDGQRRDFMEFHGRFDEQPLVRSR